MERTDPTPWLRRTTGGTLVVAGLAMLVLPGPGLVTLAAGLAMLERDLPVVRRGMTWARRTWARWSSTG